MKTRLTLPSGTTYGTNSNGQRVCTGTQMGRQTSFPPEGRFFGIKLQMEKLQLVDGAYDKWGAYWGSPNNLYCAWNDGQEACVFVRANNRQQAKSQVRLTFPNARFYR